MVPKVVSNIENAIRFDGLHVIGQNIEAFLSLAAQYPPHQQHEPITHQRVAAV